MLEQFCRDSEFTWPSHWAELLVTASDCSAQCDCSTVKQKPEAHCHGVVDSVSQHKNLSASFVSFSTILFESKVQI